MARRGSELGDGLELQVEIVSDYICPWCYLGYRRFAAAVQNLPQPADVTVRWVPYLLNPRLDPNAPYGAGIPKRKAYLKKFDNSEARVQKMEASMTALFEAEGIRYELDGTMGSTLNAHRLAELAGDKGLQTRFAEVMFERYHSRGLNPAGRENLVEAAAQAGIDPKEAAAVLDSDAKINEVAAALQTASGRYPMLSGVPHFVVKVARRPGATADGDEEGMVRTVVPGAQDTEVFRFALMKLLARAGYGESGAVAAAKM
eukprot:g1421.t1